VIAIFTLSQTFFCRTFILFLSLIGIKITLLGNLFITFAFVIIIFKGNFNLPDMNAVRDILPTFHSALSAQQQPPKQTVQSHTPIVEPDQSKFEETKQSANQSVVSRHTAPYYIFAWMFCEGFKHKS